MIPHEAVTIESLSGLLDNAVIDWTLTQGQHLYVTDLAVPLWVEHEPDAGRVILRTYWPVRAEATELDVLRFANSCNAGLVMIQFWISEEPRRFFGQYALGCKDGLDRRQFIRALRQFAEIFSMAVRDNDERDVLCDSVNGGDPMPEMG